MTDTPRFARTIFCVMDSVGIGNAPDAADFDNDGLPDTGADTLGHIMDTGRFRLPNLQRAGLGNCMRIASGSAHPHLPPAEHPQALVCSAIENSAGKDTPSGHYELCGLPVREPWMTFPKTEPCFPQEIIDAWIREAALPGVLGQRHSSGTVILEELGAAHFATGSPIIYTSADSVFQIAAHEDPDVFGLERLYDVCRIARRLFDPLNLGRVIARPFTGNPDDGFTRTGNRRDYAMPPPDETLLDVAVANGAEVVSVGKIEDIFARQGISRGHRADGLDALFEATLEEMAGTDGPAIIFTNFVDFDSKYGHRRDVEGYGRALEFFDSRLPELLAAMREDDLLIITADHGNDPSWPGTDHTREQVPVLLFGAGLAGEAGVRQSFADVGQTIAAVMDLPALKAGTSLL